MGKYTSHDRATPTDAMIRRAIAIPRLRLVPPPEPRPLRPRARRLRWYERLWRWLRGASGTRLGLLLLAGFGSVGIVVGVVFGAMGGRL